MEDLFLFVNKRPYICNVSIELLHFSMYVHICQYIRSNSPIAIDAARWRSRNFILTDINIYISLEGLNTMPKSDIFILNMSYPCPVDYSLLLITR